MSADTIKMSFSGSDADVYVYVPSDTADNRTKLISLNSIQTISVSVFRDKVPVRAIGFTNVQGHTRGVRTIAGSMIFAILNDHPFWELVKNYSYEWSYDRYAGQASASQVGRNIYSDIIPPFNIVIAYQNELGSAAVLELIGVDITNDGLVTSIEDLLTEDTMQYRARDMRIFQAVVGANALEPHTGLLAPEAIEDLIDSVSTAHSTKNNISIPKAGGKSLADLKRGSLRG